jgi:hypothetical protein
VTAAIDAGATHVSPILLHLRPIVRDVYMGWLSETYPDLVPRYEEMYRRAYAPNHDRNALGHVVAGIENDHGGLKGHNAHRRRARERRAAAKRAAEEAERLKVRQLTLV